jgi:quercetin dioxygenase-like cupin family protein
VSGNETSDGSGIGHVTTLTREDAAHTEVPVNPPAFRYSDTSNPVPTTDDPGWLSASLCLEKESYTVELTAINTDSIAPVVYDWGAVKWVVNDTVAVGSEQSFGIVYIHPGKTNPTHWHTTAQEVVHMLQGECDIETDGTTIKLRPGQTLFIPVGVHHELRNNGWEPAVYVCSFSASWRGTYFADPAGPGVKPLALSV